MFIFFASLLVACENSEKNKASRIIQEYMHNNIDNSNSSQMEICPMCKGTGIFETMPGSPFSQNQTCSACSGNGLCDATTAQSVRDAKAQVDRMYGGSSSTGNYGDGGSRQSNERRCWNCNGSGKCTQCAGRGEVRYEGMYGQPGGIMDCSICKGRGVCKICNGRGTR